MNAGYVKVHRAILHHWLWEDPKRLRAWLYLLFEAGWERRKIPNGDDSLILERGQLSTTIRKLNGAWGYYSEATLKLLNLFEKYEMIRRKSYPTMTVITIVNYDEYQLDRLDAERNTKRKSKHIKEDNNEEEKKLIFNSTTTREDNFNFFEEIKSDENFWQDAIKGIFGNPDNRDECLKWLREKAESFWGERCSKHDFRATRAKLQEYLFNWLRSAYEKELGRADKKNSIANEYENKYAARRGTDAGSHSEKDYGGSF